MDGDLFYVDHYDCGQYRVLCKRKGLQSLIIANGRREPIHELCRSLNAGTMSLAVYAHTRNGGKRVPYKVGGMNGLEKLEAR